MICKSEPAGHSKVDDKCATVIQSKAQVFTAPGELDHGSAYELSPEGADGRRRRHKRVWYDYTDEGMSDYAARQLAADGFYFW